MTKDYLHPSIVAPPSYDSLPPAGDGHVAAQKVDELRHLLEDPAVLQAVRALLPA